MQLPKAERQGQLTQPCHTASFLPSCPHVPSVQLTGCCVLILLDNPNITLLVTSRLSQDGLRFNMTLASQVPSKWDSAFFLAQQDKPSKETCWQPILLKALSFCELQL